VGRTLLSVAFDLEVEVDLEVDLEVEVEVDVEVEADLLLGSFPSRGRTVEERRFSAANSPQKMKLAFSPRSS
jgi:hypothetical protein